MKLNRALILLTLGLLTGCSNNMVDQPKYKPYSKNSFFTDGKSDRPWVYGTIPRGGLKLDELLYQGRVDGNYARTFPFPVTKAILLRGQERYNIYCAVCHDTSGNGTGMVVRRGFPKPESLHVPRLKEAPVGYHYDVITNGFRKQMGFASIIPTEDRWAIVAYIKALQLSQNATVQDVPEISKGKTLDQLNAGLPAQKNELTPLNQSDDTKQQP